MKLPSQKRIMKEDLTEAPAWIDGLIDPLNSFMATVYQALNKNINEDNTASFVKEITYTTTSTYVSGTTEDAIEFTSLLKTKAIGLAIMQIVEKGTYTTPLGPCYAAWVDSDGTIMIRGISGLAASKTYTVRVRIT